MHNADMIEAINNAIGAHGRWKMRLRTAIAQGKGEVTSKIACCDDQCAFGKWIYGPDLAAPVKAAVPYQVIKRLHAEFHQSAGSVLAYVENRDGAKARDIMEGEFIERSEKLVRALTKWKGELASSQFGVGSRAA